MKSPKKPGAVRVEVTARDIRLGVRGDTCRCPIARALKRATRCKEAVSGLWWCTVETAEHEFRADTPRVALRFMGAFDDGQPVKPFTFTLRGWR